MRLVIAGGSGFLGLGLAHHLAAAGHEVTILSRSEPVAGPYAHVALDGRSLGAWTGALEGADGLVNLAGRSVDCVKTPAHRDEILRSRVESTRVLGQALRQLDAPPPVWVQMSTAHIYGDPPRVLCTESAAFGAGFAPFVARSWEDAHAAALLEGQRSVVLRTSFVVGRDRGAGRGAMDRLTGLVRVGLGGPVGDGTQGFSWIHERDLFALFERALGDDGMSGAYVASAPEPVSQRAFMRALRHAMGVPVGLPATGWMVRIGAPLLLRTDPELALYGRYVRSERIGDDQFSFPRLDAALADLFG